MYIERDIKNPWYIYTVENCVCVCVRALTQSIVITVPRVVQKFLECSSAAPAEKWAPSVFWAFYLILGTQT